MLINITRKEKTVTASTDSGRVERSCECRSVRCAVALETKLISETSFAAWWVFAGDPKPPDLKRLGPAPADPTMSWLAPCPGRLALNRH